MHALPRLTDNCKVPLESEIDFRRTDEVVYSLFAA